MAALRHRGAPYGVDLRIVGPSGDEAVRTFEYRFIKSSGETFDGGCRRAASDREGRFVRTWAVIVDITAQK
jgi:hypothetical protein